MLPTLSSPIFHTPLTDRALPVRQYCDGAYIATVMSCLAFSLVMAVAPGQLDGYQPNSESAQLERRTNSDLLQQGIDQVTRYMTMDRLVPSYHNVVTIAGLDLKLQLTMLGLIPNDVRFFLGYTRCVLLWLSTLAVLADTATDS